MLPRQSSVDQDQWLIERQWVVHHSTCCIHLTFVSSPSFCPLNLRSVYDCCRGHGTQVVDGELVATVCGVVDRVNKLVGVRPVGSRYVAQVGDVVLGRIVEVGEWEGEAAMHLCRGVWCWAAYRTAQNCKTRGLLMLYHPG